MRHGFVCKLIYNFCVGYDTGIAQPCVVAVDVALYAEDIKLGG